MKAYTSIWKLRFMTGLQYRTAALAGIVTQLFFGLIFMMVFIAFYEQSSVVPPMPLTDLIDYMWLQQIFLGFVALWFRDNDIFELITSGNIAYELSRPCDLYGFWYAKLIAARLSSVALRCAPLLLIVFFLPEPYRMHLPESFVSLLLFLIALSLGLLINVGISMMIYISVFWTMSPNGSILLIAVLGEFFAGMIVPIPFMPQWLQFVVSFLPYRWATDFPFRVYSGHIPSVDALSGIGIQLVCIGML